MGTERRRYGLEEYWPTDRWLEAYRRRLEESGELADAGEGWGVGWTGQMIFHIRDVPTDSPVSGLPDELVAGIVDAIDGMDEDRLEDVVSGAPRLQDAVAGRSGSTGDRVTAAVLEAPAADAPALLPAGLREGLPDVVEEVLTQIDRNVVEGDTVYAWLDLYDGGCRDVAVLGGLEEREHGFVIAGDYDQWKLLVGGEANVLSQIMAGEMDVEGDVQKLMRYSDAAVAMTDVAADTRSRFLF